MDIKRPRLSGIRLNRIGSSEPLSLISLMLIGILDLFVFSSIMTGTYEQTAQLTAPHEFIPRICQEIAIDDRWRKDNYIERLSDRELSRRYSDYYRKKQAQVKVHPVCSEIIQGLTLVQNNKELIDLFRERRKLEEKYKSYDLYKKQNFPEAKQLLLSIQNMDSRINDFNEVKEIWERIETSAPKADQLAEDLRQINFIYPVKRLSMKLMFILPLFLAFYFWNSVSISKKRPFQTFLSSHMLVVSFFPLSFWLVDLLLEIIPEHLIEVLIAYLKSIYLVGLWHYIVIALMIGGGMLMIYFIQRKVFTRERLVTHRLAKKQCIDCGRKLPTGSSYCPFCGGNQWIECPKCKEKTLKGPNFCNSCGARQ